MVEPLARAATAIGATSDQPSMVISQPWIRPADPTNPHPSGAEIVEFMESSKVQKAKTPLASCLLILGALRDASAAKTVLKHLDRKMPPAVRNHALLLPEEY